MALLKEILREVEDGALDKKGEDVVLLDVKKLSNITDYYIIISAQNDRQIKAIRDEIEHRLKSKYSFSPKHMDGIPSSKWVVLDYTDFIVHIFDGQLRRYYELERLWGDAKVKKV
ncbi:MAG: ribosome silencing factor [Candidatus Aureabacteria bacterium]|nr:ribosome silencing factor [Candidatus Auribacterota bacterium]